MKKIHFAVLCLDALEPSGILLATTTNANTFFRSRRLNVHSNIRLVIFLLAEESAVFIILICVKVKAGARIKRLYLVIIINNCRSNHAIMTCKEFSACKPLLISCSGMAGCHRSSYLPICLCTLHLIIWGQFFLLYACQLISTPTSQLSCLTLSLSDICCFFVVDDQHQLHHHR